MKFILKLILGCLIYKVVKEELQSLKEVGVNIVFVQKTSLAIYKIDSSKSYLFRLKNVGYTFSLLSPKNFIVGLHITPRFPLGGGC